MLFNNILAAGGEEESTEFRWQSTDFLHAWRDNGLQGEIPIEKISGKSVLVIDEFQDVNEEEYKLFVRTIGKRLKK